MSVVEEVGSVPTGPHIPVVPPCRLLVKGTAGARVVGKGGDSIRSIRASSGATVRVFQDELPDILKRRNENIVVVSCGEEAHLHRAISGILERIFDRSGIPDASERSRERPFSLDVIVPERASAQIVGPGGERVKALIEELQCNVDVVREPVAGLASQRRVRLLSRHKDRVEAGVFRLQQILVELLGTGTLQQDEFELREALPTDAEQERLRKVADAGEVPLRFLLAPGEAAVVVGKMGNNVARLRDIARVSVDNAESPPFLPEERVCHISSGPLSDRLRAARLVIADLALSVVVRSEGWDAVKTIPEGYRSVLIRLLLPNSGRGLIDALLETPSGEDSSRCPLQLETGAQPSIHSDQAEMFTLTLKGSEDQVAAALWRVHQSLEPWEFFDVPPKPEFVTVSERVKRDVEEGDRRVSDKPRENGSYFRKESAADCKLALARSPSPQDEGSGSVVLLKEAPSSQSSWPGVVCPAGDRVCESQSSVDRLAERSRDETSRMNATSVAAQREGVVNMWTADLSSSLFVAVPSDVVASTLAHERSGIAQSAGVKLRAVSAEAARSIGTSAVEITGPVAARAVACYFVQVQLWHLSALSV